MDADLICCVL
jgi:kinetochore protein Spc7/SPC105